MGVYHHEKQITMLLKIKTSIIKIENIHFMPFTVSPLQKSHEIMYICQFRLTYVLLVENFNWIGNFRLSEVRTFSFILTI